MASNKTPGYNCRLTIKFSADKSGRPLARYRLLSRAWRVRAVTPTELKTWY